MVEKEVRVEVKILISDLIIMEYLLDAGLTSKENKLPPSIFSRSIYISSCTPFFIILLLSFSQISDDVFLSQEEGQTG